MTATPIPLLNTQDRRVVSPEGNFVEPVEATLYSVAGLASGNLPQDLVFFNYGRGDTIAGAGNLVLNGETARVWHTNLDKGGILGTPKSFLATALRFYLVPLTFTTAAAGASPALPDPGFDAAALADGEFIEDLRTIMETAHVQLVVGKKAYADEPLFTIPGNVGFGGRAAVSVGANAGSHHLDISLAHWSGQERSFLPYPVRIPPQQTFSLTMSWRWATVPTLNNHCALFALLDGKLAREVQ